MTRRRTRAKQVCKEYRLIPNRDMPQPKAKEFPDDPEPELNLADLGYYVLYVGTTNTLAVCVGYEGAVWPGTLLAGAIGTYRTQRLVLIEQSLRAYNDGVSGGKIALLDTPFADEVDLVVDGLRVSIGRPLTPSERLARRVPRIMGDG